MRARVVFALAATSVLGVVLACADLGGLSGEPPPDAAAESQAPPPPGSEGGPGDAAPDVVNPTTGLSAFLLYGQSSDGGYVVAPIAVDPRDGGIETLDCARAGIDLVKKGGLLPEALGPFGMRVFYEPTDPSRAKIVFPTEPSTNNALYVVTTDSRCGGGTAPRDVTTGVVGNKLMPSFSPDGKRVAFFSANAAGSVTTVVTAATEGQLDQFEMRNLADAGRNYIVFANPVWVADTEGLKVAWAENSGPDMVVRLALDKAITTTDPPLLLNCGSIFYGIHQIGIFRGLGGKTYVAFVALLTDPDAGSQATGIFAVDYKVDCSTRQLLFGDTPTSYSGDFAVASDGDRMAHVADRTVVDNGGVDRRRVWIGSVTSHSRKVCSAPPPGAYDIAPQWLAADTQLIWTRVVDGGGNAMIADVSGDVCTNERTLGPTGPTDIVLTPRNGCSASGGAPSTVDALFLALLVVALRARSAARGGARRSDRDA
jgi:hypothetical protein